MNNMIKLKKYILLLKRVIFEQEQRINILNIYLEEIRFKIEERWGLDEYDRIITEVTKETEERMKNKAG